jgi:maltose alpha-D-glucosyltransferase/alpha-amylase
VSEADSLPGLITVTTAGGALATALEGSEGEQLRRAALPDFLRRQRWFAGKGGAIRIAAMKPMGSLPGEPNQLTVVEAEAPGGETQRYLLPLSVLWGENNLRPDAPQGAHTLARVQEGAGQGALVDASFDERFIRDLLAAMQSGVELPAREGSFRFSATEAFRALNLGGAIRALGAEQSNVSLKVDDQAMVKLYRRLRSGEQPEIEVAQFLTEVAGFRNTPAFLGSAEHVAADGERTALAAAFAFVPNQGDTWSVVLEALAGALDSFAGGNGSAAPDFARSLDLAGTLGRRTAEMHVALASPSDDPAFAAEPIEAADLGRWVDDTQQEARRGAALLERALADVPEADRADVARLRDGRQQVLDRLEAIRALHPSGMKTRIHGDYHLGQVLAAGDDVIIIDFEGEPQRDVHERRQKSSPLRDVAGMLRSFDYAAWSALDQVRGRRGSVDDRVRRHAFQWRERASQRFLDEYWAHATRGALLPEDSATRRGMLELFLFQKAFYEVGYEAANRPAWLSIPVRGLLDLVFPPKAPQ